MTGHERTSTTRPGTDPRLCAAVSFGIDAARYDRSRPRYPQAMIEQLLASCPGREVLDVGCGTGILARQLQAAGATVLGVDPDARMADFARASGVAVEISRFEDWDAAGRTFDAVLAGQTWHWVDPAAGAGRAAAALAPGGRLALLWNASDLEPELVRELAAVHDRITPDSPFRPWAQSATAGYGAVLTPAADAIRSSGAFGEPERSQQEWEAVYTREQWLDQLPTSGAYTRLPPAQLASLLAAVGAAVDAVGGRVAVRYTTIALTATRLG